MDDAIRGRAIQGRAILGRLRRALSRPVLRPAGGPGQMPPWWGVGALAFGLLAAVPLAFLLANALSAQGRQVLWSFAAEAGGRRVVFNTVILAATVGVLATAGGALAAYTQLVVRPAFRSFLHFALLIPMILPPFVVPAVGTMLWGRGGIFSLGVLGLPLDFYGFGALVAVQCVCFMPTAYLVCLSVLQAFNPDLVTSAKTLGCAPSRIATTLLLPALTAALRRSFLLVAMESVADLANPLALAGDFRVLSLAAYLAAVSDADLARASAYASVILVVNLVALGLTRGAGSLVAGRWDWAAHQLSQRPGPGQLTHGPLVRGALQAYLWSCAAGGLLLVVTVIIGSITQVPGVIWAYTPAHYQRLLGSGAQVVANSVTLAALAVPGVLILGLGLAGYRHLARRPALRHLENGALHLVMMLISLPGTVVGLAFLVAFSVPWKIGGWEVLPRLVGGSAWGSGAAIIVVAYIIRCQSLIMGLLQVAAGRIDGATWQSARSLGLTGATLRRALLWPALGSALIAGAGLSFNTALSSLSSVAFLSSSRWEVLTVWMLTEVDGANFGAFFAATTLTLVIAALVQALSGHLAARATRRWQPLPARPRKARPETPNPTSVGQIEIRQLRKEYPGPTGPIAALRGIDLHIPGGTLVAVVGASGCGKSTLLRLIAGLEEPGEGQILIDGQDQAGISPQERACPLVPQGFSLFPHLNVAQNVAYALEGRGWEEARRREIVQVALTSLNLEGLAERRPADLSVGQAQRVALARALVLHPKVLLLDEPLSNLDPAMRAEARADLIRLQKRLGITVLYVTHDPEEALALGEKILILRAGQVEQWGSAEQVYRRPHSILAAQATGATNFLSCQVLTRPPTGRWKVRALGRDFSLPGGPHLQGREVTLLLRREDIRLREIAAPRGWRVEGRYGMILDWQYLGSRLEYQVDTAAGTLVVADFGAGPSQAWPPGSAVEIDFDPARATLLPADY